MYTKINAITLLEMLPDKPRQIAHELRDMGIVGIWRDGNNCPLAIYLEMNGINATVNPSHMFIGENPIFLPTNIRNFINRFDLGFYRYLRD